MDLSHPIAAITTPLTARVLDVLAGTSRPLSGREIHRLAGAGSHTGVWRILLRLEHHGLVEVDHRSSASLFTANREHLAWPAIEALVQLRTAVLGLLTSTISAWEIPPAHASVFGSFARGDADEESDIDVLLLRDLGSESSLDQWEAQLAGLRESVRRATGNRCQTYDLDIPRLARHVEAGDPVVDSWRRDEVLLVGPSISDVVAAVP